jgi:hypothetical protein
MPIIEPQLSISKPLLDLPEANMFDFQIMRDRRGIRLVAHDSNHYLWYIATIEINGMIFIEPSIGRNSRWTLDAYGRLLLYENR